MKVVWVTRSFLDYRIPVFEDLFRRLDGRFALVFNADYVPDRCRLKVEKVLGSAARGLRGERALTWGPQKGFSCAGLRLSYQPGLVRAVMEEKPDVLISDGFFQWTCATLWLRATRGIPHVMCYEKTPHTERNAQWYRNTYRRTVLRWIDAMCCNGRLCGEYARHLGFAPDRITYGHMVADVEGLRQNAAVVTERQIGDMAAKHQLEGMVFLFAGRLIRLKGLTELFVAWRQLMADVRQRDATLLIAGDGPQRQELEQYCHDHGVSNVRFAGAVDYDKLHVYYRCAHVFVMPSLEDNWSLVVPEAMACGLPILCSRYNGCWPELVTPANGWVFDPLSPSDLVGALRRTLSSKAALPDMGKASQAIVSTHTPERAGQAICDAIDLACRVRQVEPVAARLSMLPSQDPNADHQRR
jgi:glycosyltransferase involved in cell wall biosynthesis